MSLVRSLGDAEHDAVACSQGDVIPGLVARIAETDAYPLEGPIETAKGGTWALTLDLDGRLVAADGLDAPRPQTCIDLAALR